MALRVVVAVEGRHEDRLAPVEDDFVTATDRAVVRWSTTGDVLTDTVVHLSDQYHPGPLAWLGGPSRLAWGPTVLDGGQPAWTATEVVGTALADLGSGAPRHFTLVAGAVSADARHVAMLLERRPSRVAASRAKEPALPALRLAIVEPTTHRIVDIVDDPGRAAGALAWADGPLLVGTAGKVIVRGGEPMVIGDGTAPRSLAVSPAGTITAGAASGRIFTRSLEWSAHEGPVTALAWQDGDLALATGGTDGWVRVWSPVGELLAGLRLDGEVEAVGWLGGGALAAKAGGPGGRLYLLGLDG